MCITKEQILNKFSKMSVMDILKLISMMEKKFGVSSSSIINTPKKSSKNEVIKEKSEFNVFLKSIGTNKIAVIKVVRSIIGLGLKEAKDLVESFPVLIKEKVNKNDSLNIKTSLEKVGAVIEIK